MSKASHSRPRRPHCVVEDPSDDFWINGVGTDPLAVGNSSIEPCKYKGVAYAVIPMRTLNFYLVRAAAALVFTFYLTACGGGGWWRERLYTGVGATRDESGLGAY